MSTDSHSDRESRRPSRRQFSLRSLLIAVVALSVVMSCVAWYRRAVYLPLELKRQIDVTVRSLANKRPPTMTRGQWASAVAWTSNLVGNSLWGSEADVGDLRRFQRELDARAEGDVDMDTILWIWDEVACLTHAGKEYQEYRVQMLEEIETVGPNERFWLLDVP